MIMPAESGGSADTHLLKAQARLSCWTSVTATHICCAAEAGNSTLGAGLCARHAAAMIMPGDMMQVWVCTRNKSMIHCICIAINAALAFGGPTA